MRQPVCTGSLPTPPKEGRLWPVGFFFGRAMGSRRPWDTGQKVRKTRAPSGVHQGKTPVGIRGRNRWGFMLGGAHINNTNPTRIDTKAQTCQGHQKAHTYTYAYIARHSAAQPYTRNGSTLTARCRAAATEHCTLHAPATRHRGRVGIGPKPKP